MTRPDEFLKEAIDTVRQRGTDNGYDAGQERSAAKIAAVFNTLTGHTLTEADAWTFLIVLKLVRNQRKYKHDNIVDGAGYLALLGECLSADEDAARVDMLSRALANASRCEAAEKQGPAKNAVARDIRPHISFALASGHQLDAYGAMIKTPRKQITSDTEPAYVEWETDKNYRDRLTETARQADLCLHRLYEDRDGKTFCVECKAEIVIAEF